jgi:hypothetical protein
MVARPNHVVRGVVRHYCAAHLCAPCAGDIQVVRQILANAPLSCIREVWRGLDKAEKVQGFANALLSCIREAPCACLAADACGCASELYPRGLARA